MNNNIEENNVNQEVIVNNSVINQSEDKIDKKNVLLVVLATILVWASFDFIIGNFYNLYSFFGIKLVGIFIYYSLLKKKYIKLAKIFLIIEIIAVIACIYGYNSLANMENTGIDALGEAIVYGAIYRISLLVFYLISFVYFILCSKKILFRKKVLITIGIIIGFCIILSLGLKRSSYEKVEDENMKTANDFKEELIERNLYVDDNLLFGIDDNKEYQVFLINFSEEKEYPTYVYYGYKIKNPNYIEKYHENNYLLEDEYLNWIIYYTNGNIYASLLNSSPSQFNKNGVANYYDKLYGAILTENNVIYIYSKDKNRYEKVSSKKECIYDTTLRVNKLGTNIKDEEKWVKYLKKESFENEGYLCYEFKKIDKIDGNALYDYVMNLRRKEDCYSNNCYYLDKDSKSNIASNSNIIETSNSNSQQANENKVVLEKYSKNININLALNEKYKIGKYRIAYSKKVKDDNYYISITECNANRCVYKTSVLLSRNTPIRFIDDDIAVEYNNYYYPKESIYLNIYYN